MDWYPDVVDFLYIQLTNGQNPGWVAALISITAAIGVVLFHHKTRAKLLNLTPWGCNVHLFKKNLKNKYGFSGEDVLQGTYQNTKVKVEFTETKLASEHWIHIQVESPTGFKNEGTYPFESANLHDFQYYVNELIRAEHDQPSKAA